LYLLYNNNFILRHTHSLQGMSKFPEHQGADCLHYALYSCRLAILCPQLYVDNLTFTGLQVRETNSGVSAILQWSKWSEKRYML